MYDIISICTNTIVRKGHSMTKLEQYQKAYALLVGRVDRILGNLEAAGGDAGQAAANLALTAGALTAALQDAEEVFLAGDPEDE